ncbi:MAG: AAA family ATPase [Oscillospiraceae bacterium]
MGTKTTVDVEGIRQQLADYMAATGKKQSKIAKELEISETTLSLFRNGTYTGNNEEIAAKLEQLLRIGNSRQLLPQPPAFNPKLPVTRAIMNTVEHIHISKEIGLIYGRSGTSKTTTLKYYTSLNNSTVVYIQANITSKSVRGILKLILKTIGKSVRGSSSDYSDYLVDYFLSTQKLLIIDEAQHLSIDALQAIRNINELAEVGIILAGNPSIYDNLNGANEEVLDQLNSRIGRFCEVENKHTKKDMRMLFPDVNDECLIRLRALATARGGLRVVMKHYTMAVDTANALQQPLDISHFDHARSRISVGVKDDDE